MQQQTVSKFYSDERTRGRVGGTIREYLGFFDESSNGNVEVRKADYARMINDYYDLVTDFYEHGWGESFHFAPRMKGESFEASLARSEHFFALQLGLRPGMKVLDVGCGVGGPMRTIARFSGATVEGINNNEYQINKLQNYNEASRLSGQCSAFKGDFMNFDVPDSTYDAAYAFEATCHAPDKVGVFKEILRVLKPGAMFAGFEWCMTDAYDPNDAYHREVKHEIETGDSLPDIATIPQVIKSLQTAGLNVLQSYDTAELCDPETPWYLPLKGEWANFGMLRRGRFGRLLARRTIKTLEALRIAPKGSAEVSNMLGRAAEALIAGGELKIFTPNYFFLAQRPD